MNELEALKEDMAALRAEISDLKQSMRGETRTRKMVIVDEDCKARIELGVDEDNISNLSLLDENGKKRVRLFADAEAAGLSLFDAADRLVAGLNGDRSYRELSLYDEKGKKRMSMSLFVVNAEWARDLQDVGHYLQEEVAGPHLRVYDDEGKTRMSLNVDFNGPKLRLCDPKGKDIWSASHRITA